MKNIFKCLILGILWATVVQIAGAQTFLKGRLTDKETGEALIGGTIKVMKDSQFIRGAVTDFEGKYRLAIDTGTYTIEACYTGYSSERKAGIIVYNGVENIADMALSVSTSLQEVVIKEYKTPLVTTQVCTSLEIKQSVKLHPKKAKAAPSKDIQIRGARAAGTNYYVDGVRVSGTPANIANPKRENKEEDEELDYARSKKVGMARDSILPEYNSENYNAIIENPFMEVTKSPVSTFSIDVDVASYANIRRFLNGNMLPPPDAVRIEEMINYFDYQYQAPRDQHPFEVMTEVGVCPWNPSHRLALVGIQGRETEVGQLPPSNLVFLIDVSGSMSSPDKLPLVKASLNLLVDQLRPEDRVAMVVYAGAAGLVLEPTSGADKAKIKQAIEKLESGGSTAGGAGIQLAYNTARKEFKAGGNNRVILCTDGDFNVGISDEKGLVSLIEKERESGVYLTILGYGTGNYQDGKMQMLADKGNGNHAYIDGLDEAKKVLVKEFGGTLVAIAKDVKIQIDFDPKKVQSYRLIGYENRMLAKEDFDDDKKDAGELGSGHRVTALYEIIPNSDGTPLVTTADYKPNKQPANAGGERLMTLKLRYKRPNGSHPSTLIEKDFVQKTGAPSDNMLLASSVAEFGMLLRQSKQNGNSNWSEAIARAKTAAINDPNGYRAEMVQLMEIARKLSENK